MLTIRNFLISNPRQLSGCLLSEKNNKCNAILTWLLLATINNYICTTLPPLCLSCFLKISLIHKSGVLEYAACKFLNLIMAPELLPEWSSGWFQKPSLTSNGQTKKANNPLLLMPLFLVGRLGIEPRTY